MVLDVTIKNDFFIIIKKVKAKNLVYEIGCQSLLTL